MLFLVLIHTVSAENPKQSGVIKIGILAKSGADECLEQWLPTADYLARQIPGYSFEIVPLGYKDVYRTVETNDVDFILANSSYYVTLEMQYGAGRIATMKNLSGDATSTIFGGVIFCRSDRTDIETIAEWIDGSKRYFIQQFKITDSIISESLHAEKPYKTQELQEMCNTVKHHFKECMVRGT